MLRDLLKGLEARTPQSVANMCVIPLVAQDTEYHKVGTMADIYLDRDTAYNSLTLGTQSNQPTILPAGYTLITKERAQDRTVASKTLLPAKQATEVSAFCVQSSQPGHMSKGNKEMQQVRMLPATVRKAAYANRNNSSFQSLWATLGQYNSKLGLRGDFLMTFFENFTTQLDQFIAEFELVPYQRGAIILINDEVIGVELSPNALAFSAQWEPLIRDCYGSEAISRQKDHKVVDESAIFGDVDTFEGLMKRLDEFEDQECDFAERCINDVLSQVENTTRRQSESGLEVLDVETPDFVGQAIKNGTDIIDLTLLRRDAAERGFKFAKARR